ncbi:MAG: TetR/AcrR family transcriptional regulator [Prevotellaceae bacterium]|jgi:AcrR family transcriptional regulator|nr:TetR/AcrR family transcriptional regulator [Prevotellaceae bacterium]
MNGKELSTEKIILAAAEAEFLEKGYGSTKTVAIAKRAGVSHSMLHYYFRTKENLFQMIFLEKVQMLSKVFEGILVQHLSFAETVRMIVESQFDFVRQNPGLPHFVLNEIVSNRENRAIVLEALYPKISGIFGNIEKILSAEIAKGAVRPIGIGDFMMNLLALNISTFVALPVWREISPGMNGEMLEQALNERRESNVQFILNALRL